MSRSLVSGGSGLHVGCGVGDDGSHLGWPCCCAAQQVDRQMDRLMNRWMWGLGSTKRALARQQGQLP